MLYCISRNRGRKTKHFRYSKQKINYARKDDTSEKYEAARGLHLFFITFIQNYEPRLWFTIVINVPYSGGAFPLFRVENYTTTDMSLFQNFVYFMHLNYHYEFTAYIYSTCVKYILYFV